MRHAAVTIAKIALPFVLLGPLIGLVTFAFCMALLAMASGIADGHYLVPFFLIYGLIFAHFVGLASALVAAVTAAALALWLDRFPAWIGLASGLTALAIAGLRGSAFLPNGTEETFKTTMVTSGVGFVLVIAVTHVAAASGSWALARRWLRPKPA